MVEVIKYYHMDAVRLVGDAAHGAALHEDRIEHDADEEAWMNSGLIIKKETVVKRNALKVTTTPCF